MQMIIFALSQSFHDDPDGIIGSQVSPSDNLRKDYSLIPNRKRHDDNDNSDVFQVYTVVGVFEVKLQFHQLGYIITYTIEYIIIW